LSPKLRKQTRRERRDCGEAALPQLDNQFEEKKLKNEPNEVTGYTTPTQGNEESARNESKTEFAEREGQERRRGCATLPRLVDCEKGSMVAN
jgi:hypothetical protein